MNNFEEYLTHSLDHVENGIVKEAALYSLLNGGKRFRPNLLFATLEAYHISTNKGIKAAVALEMIHTYSLIHDDLPSMDNDDLRRGMPTCHIKYGEGTAILAGDALLTEAFLYANNATDNVSTNHSIVNDFISSNGLGGMIYGQELDIKNNDESIDVQCLEKINTLKTSKLITLSFTCAALIANRKGDKDAWIQIGANVGQIFQIQDDLLDIHATSDELGKNTNSDLRNKKTTYASLLSVEECERIIQNLYTEVLMILDTLMIDKDPLVAILDKLLSRKK